MLSIFKSSADNEAIEGKNLEFEKNLAKKEAKIKLLEDELKKYKEQIKFKDDEIESLKWKISEEKENNKESETNIFKSQYDDLLELYGFENENLVHSLVDIQSNIAESTHNAKESLKLSSNVDKNFEKAFNDIEVIVTNLDKLLTKSNNVASVIEDLSKKALNIEKFIAQINEVVMQINILSLNASVEAASAGDAGKGFAVVASEVKNLANKTAYVATDIEKTVKSIQDSIKNTNSEFKEIDNTINNIHLNTNNYNSEIHDLHHLTSKTLIELSNLSDSFFMNLAKIDHVIWKVNTYESVYAKKSTFKFEDHNNCRLGKWYNEGDGIKYFSNASSFHKLVRPHAGVHDTTNKILDLLKEEDEDINYRRIKNTFAYMEESSKEVFLILNSILEETVEK